MIDVPQSEKLPNGESAMCKGSIIIIYHDFLPPQRRDSHVKSDNTHTQSSTYNHPARGRVGRVTDCGVRGLEFKSPGSILTSRKEPGSLSREVRDGWEPSSVPVSL